MDLVDLIQEVLRTPLGANQKQPTYGFNALAKDGSIHPWLSETDLAEAARSALMRCVPGVAFSSISVNRDRQSTRIEIGFLDELHDPSLRTTVVDFEGRHVDSAGRR